MVDLPPGYSDPRPLGQGGFGQVLCAWSEALGRDVAVKLPFDDADRDFARELALELHAAASLRHPNIVQVLDAGVTEAGQHFLVMEYADAGSMADLVDWPRRWSELLPLLLGVLDGLGHAHARGIVHRDIKAANVLLSRDDDGRLVPRIADFGLAKVLQEHGWYDSTRMGAGTMLYMPPEQFDRDLSAIHPGADLYAFGVLLYHLVCGRAPWDDRGLGPLLAAKAAGRFEPLRPPPDLGVPSGLQPLARRLLAPRPAERPELAADVRAELLSLGAPDLSGLVPAGREESIPPASLPAAAWGVDYEDSAFVAVGGRRELPSAPPELAEPPPWPCSPGIVGVRVPKLAGRGPERRALWSSARAASHGPLGLSLEGPPGVGRSRLCQWLLRTLEEAGLARPLHVRAAGPQEVEDAFVIALRRLIGLGRMTGAPLRDRVERWCVGRGLGQDDAVQLVAWLDRRAADPPSGPGVDPVGLRNRRLAVLERVLRVLARRGVACLWLEDAGGALTAVAGSLLRLAQAGPFPLLILHEPRAGAPRPDGFEALDVGPLPEEDLRALLTDLMADEARAASLSTACDGNPLVAVQSARLRAVQEQRDGGRTDPSGRPSRRLSVAEVAAARLDAFVRHAAEPDQAGLLLLLLSLLPRPVQRLTLDRAWRSLLPGGSPVPWLEAARRFGLLVVDRWGGHDFAEAAFAEPAATGLADRTAPAEVLRACAQALLAQPDRAPATELAAGRLLLEAGDAEQALATTVSAAAGLTSLDLDAAGVAWDQAARAVELLGLAPADPRVVAVVLGRARAARNVGDLRATSELLAPLDGLELEAAEAAEVRFLRCSIAMSKGDLEAVLEASAGPVDPPIRVLRAEALRRSGRVEEATAELTAGLREARGDRKAALSFGWRLARIHRLQGDDAAALAGFEAALAEARALGDLADEAIVLRELGHLHLLAGRLDEARTALREALDRSDRAGFRVATAVTRLSLGELARKDGDLPGARREYSAGLAVAHAYENANLATVALLNLAVTELAMDRTALAARRLEALDRLVAPGSEHAYRAWIETVRVAVAAARDRWDEAEATLMELGDQQERLRGQADPRELLTAAGARALEAGQLVLASEAWRLALDLAEHDGADRAADDLRRRLAALARA